MANNKKKTPKLKFFQDDNDVVQYVWSEIVATLEDDMNNCLEAGDKQQARELQRRIDDIMAVDSRSVTVSLHTPQLFAKVEVSGGVAEVTECSPGVSVEIIDHDNEKVG